MKRKLIELFEENLSLCPNEPFVFDFDTCEYKDCWEFIEKYLKENTDKVLGHNGQIVFNVTGTHIEQFICGVAPMWKEYENRSVFENYYTASEMMRELFCNEKDENGNLTPFYVSLDGEKFIVTWESDKDSDTFHYHKATVEERGLLDVFFEMFGGMTVEQDKKTYKKLNPHISVTFDKKLTNQFGFDLGISKKICDHISNLGFTINGMVSIIFG